MANTEENAIEQIDWDYIKKFMLGIERQVLKDLYPNLSMAQMPWWTEDGNVFEKWGIPDNKNKA